MLKKIKKWKDYLGRRFNKELITFYRYPFKLVIRPRKFFSNVHYSKNRYSPPGFDKKRTEYDLYIEQDSIKKSSMYLGFFIAFSLFIISCYLFHKDTSEFKFLRLVAPSLIFFSIYFFSIKSIFYYYHSYPLFAENWSKKTDCYAEWFCKIPQEIYLKKTSDNKELKKFTNKKKIIHTKEKQALYYSWNYGSAQKSMWLLSIENIIHEWEKKGVLKEKTSLIIFLSPVWFSYLSLIILLPIADICYSALVKHLYIPSIVWLFSSILYLSLIYMFILERKQNETQMDRNINRFIPYELRSSTNRYNSIYRKFKKEHFLALFNLLFSVMMAFYISLIGLVK